MLGGDLSERGLLARGYAWAVVMCFTLLSACSSGGVLERREVSCRDAQPVCLCSGSEGGTAVSECVRGVWTACECLDGSTVESMSKSDAGADGGHQILGRGDATTGWFERDAALDSGDGGLEGDTACGQQESTASIQKERPVDVIFIIDNSGSMSTEIAAVEQNINNNFARIIEESGADYRVIMITDHGAASYDVCVDTPLAARPCSDTTLPTGTTLGAPANSERFFHYDINVQSVNSVCLMLSHYEYPLGSAPVPGPETGELASPTGWHTFLREEALKVFVEISDDRLSCSAATVNPDWDFSGAGWGATAATATAVARSVIKSILELSEAQFGRPDELKFVWHSIVGIADNTPADLPYTHFDPPEMSGRCSSAGNPGPAYQMLSIGTAGLRYPVCSADEGRGFDSVFRAIAREVVRGSGVDCAFTVPNAPAGKFIDFASIEVLYTPASGPVESLVPVRVTDCTDTAFYFEQGQIKLCPAACSRVRNDVQASLAVTFQCGVEMELGPDLLLQ